ncbi:hypothetical protein ACHAPO_002139 [Fusarium lateritium]
MSKSTKSTDVNPSGFPGPISEASCPGSWPVMTKSPGSAEKTSHSRPSFECVEELKLTNPSPSNSKTDRQVSLKQGDAYSTSPGLLLARPNAPPSYQGSTRAHEPVVPWFPETIGPWFQEPRDPCVRASEKLTDLQERLDAQGKRLVKTDAKIGRQFSELIKARDEVSYRDNRINALNKVAKALSAELKEAKDDAKAQKESVMTAKADAQKFEELNEDLGSKLKKTQDGAQEYEKLIEDLSSKLKKAQDDTEFYAASTKTFKAEARKHQSKTVDLQSKITIAKKNEEFLKGRLMQSDKDGRAREARMEELIVENHEMDLELDELEKGMIKIKKDQEATEARMKKLTLENESMVLELEELKKLNILATEARVKELTLQNESMALAMDIQKKDHQKACENAKLAFEDELLMYGEVIEEVIIERDESQRKLKVAENAIEPLKYDLATFRLNQAEWALESLKYGLVEEQAEVQCITGQTDLTEEGEPQADGEEDHDEGLAEMEEGEDDEWVMP